MARRLINDTCLHCPLLRNRILQMESEALADDSAVLDVPALVDLHHHKCSNYPSV
jgi:hypothetical protein